MAPALYSGVIAALSRPCKKLWRHRPAHLRAHVPATMAIGGFTCRKGSGVDGDAARCERHREVAGERLGAFAAIARTVQGKSVAVLPPHEARLNEPALTAIYRSRLRICTADWAER